MARASHSSALRETECAARAYAQQALSAARPPAAAVARPCGGCRISSLPGLSPEPAPAPAGPAASSAPAAAGAPRPGWESIPGWRPAPSRAGVRGSSPFSLGEQPRPADELGTTFLEENLD